MTGILSDLSTQEYKYIVIGDPIPLARTRLRGAGGGVYDSQKHEKFSFGIVLKAQHQQYNISRFTVPIHITIKFYFSIPTSHRKTSQGDYHHFRPDLDNLIKFVLDSANTILFKDDAQIVTITASKQYDDLPRTELIIRT